MKDTGHTRDIIAYSTPSGNSCFYEAFMNFHQKPIFTILGVDWAKDSGFNRGDVISRDGNVIHVRFNTTIPKWSNV